MSDKLHTVAWYKLACGCKVQGSGAGPQGHGCTRHRLSPPTIIGYFAIYDSGLKYLISCSMVTVSAGKEGGNLNRLGAWEMSSLM